MFGNYLLREVFTDLTKLVCVYYTNSKRIRFNMDNIILIHYFLILNF